MTVLVLMQQALNDS